jgi:hypothetical protein
MVRSGLAAILVLLVVMSVAGASTERLSHREYVARATAVCHEMTGSMLVLPTGGREAEFRRNATIVGRAVKKLKRLSPPTADERQHDVLTDALAHVAQTLDDFPPLNRDDAEGRLLVVHTSSKNLGIRSGCGSG